MLNPLQKYTQSHRLRHWIPISLILLLAIALYLFKLGARGLWIDEIISLIDSQKLEFNKGRLLYYTLLHFWRIFGDGDAWLRGLAVLFALISVFLLYQLGRYLCGEAVGLIAALMLALSPLFINHAQEVRYYTMSVCLGLGGTLALAHALDKPTQRSPRFWWVLMRFLAVITTPLNAALLFPDLLLIGIEFRQQRSKLLAFGTSFLLILMLCIPGMISVANSSEAHKLTPPIPYLSNILRELRVFTAFSYPPPPPYLSRLIQIYVLMLLGLLGIALFTLYKQRSKNLMRVTAWAFLPLGIIFTFSHLFYSIWITRYLILACPYILLLLAVGFLRVWQRWRQVAIGIAIAYIIVIYNGLVYYYSAPERYMGARGDYRNAIQIINNNERPGDIIAWSIVHNTGAPLEHYYRGEAPIYVKKYINQDFDKPHINRWLQTLPPIQSRLWLVYGTDSEIFHEAVKEQFDIQKYQRFGSLNVFLVTRKSKI
jgi:mannosyltransferase